jgi:hypothetical protein
MGDEAAGWVEAELSRLRGLDYDALLGLEGQTLHREMTGSSGETFLVETMVFWDDKGARTLRVLVDVWPPRGRRIVERPIAHSDFIRAPDGGFVGD